MKRLLVLASLSLATLSGCSSGNGTLNVRLVDAPGDYKEINLHVLSVEIHGTSGGWQELGRPDTTVNLLSLRDGVVATLVDGATVREGTYTQLRLVLGDGNTVKLQDDSVHDLVVPSGHQSGVKVNVQFTVDANTTRDIVIDIDGAHSIMLHETGASEKYVLRPLVHGYDVLATGAILGTLTEAGTGAPLANAIVTAQAVDAVGRASIVRSAVTSETGAYLLDLLPAGGTYHVVSQPVVGEDAYVPLASPGIVITDDAPTPAWNAAFTAATDVGGVAGTITPASVSDADVVFARQSLDAGGIARTLVVRTTVPAVAAGVESYAMALMPAGDYTLDVVRRTLDSSGDETVTASAPVAVTVTAGGVAAASFAF